MKLEKSLTWTSRLDKLLYSWHDGTVEAKHAFRMYRAQNQ